MSGWYTIPLALIELELREKKTERVGRYETRRLVPKFKVSGQPVISELRSMTQKSGFGFWLITLLAFDFHNSFGLTHALVGGGAIFAPPTSSLFAISLKLQR